MKTFDDVIDRWPSIPEFAEDIDERANTCRKWRARGRIPSVAWRRVITAGESRGFPINADLLVDIAAGVDPVRSSSKRRRNGSRTGGRVAAI